MTRNNLVHAYNPDTSLYTTLSQVVTRTLQFQIHGFDRVVTTLLTSLLQAGHNLITSLWARLSQPSTTLFVLHGILRIRTYV